MLAQVRTAGCVKVTDRHTAVDYASCLEFVPHRCRFAAVEATTLCGSFCSAPAPTRRSSTSPSAPSSARRASWRPCSTGRRSAIEFASGQIPSLATRRTCVLQCNRRLHRGQHAAESNIALTRRASIRVFAAMFDILMPLCVLHWLAHQSRRHRDPPSTAARRSSVPWRGAAHARSLRAATPPSSSPNATALRSIIAARLSAQLLAPPRSSLCRSQRSLLFSSSSAATADAIAHQFSAGSS